MKKKIYLVLKVLLACAIVVGIAAISLKAVDRRRGEQSYAEAIQAAGLPQWPPLEPGTISEISGTSEVAATLEAMKKDPYAIALSQINLEALQETNSDVTGWIVIPGTEISYPIVHTDNNSYYLNHTWKKERSSVGAIFLEQYSSPDLTDFNTLVYGHKMRDGSMFGRLNSYQDIDYWKEHPSVYMTDGNGVYRYDIFAAYEVGVREIVYRLNLTEEEQKQEFIRFGAEHSAIDTGIVPEVTEQIVTLSTCTGRGHATRWVVQAVRRGEMSAR